MVDEGRTIVADKPGVVDFDDGRLAVVNVAPKRVGGATPAQSD